jgi:hypothetical protein
MKTIKLEALFPDDEITLEIAGEAFDGTQATWPIAVRFEHLAATPLHQYEFLAEILRNRARNPRAITDEWLERNLTRDLIESVIAVIFRGEDPTSEAPKPNRAARRAAGKA